MNDNADVNDMPLTLDAEYLRNDTWLLQTTNTLYFKKNYQMMMMMMMMSADLAIFGTYIAE